MPAAPRFLAHYNRHMRSAHESAAHMNTEGVMFKHILVPTDGTDLSKKAIDGAIALARTVGARVTAYACMPQYPYSPYPDDIAIELPGDFQTRSEREARTHLQEVEEAAHSVGVACDSCTSVHPSPYLGIIEAAENRGCDVIFMASHGRRGLGSLLIGSETQRVLSHTKIPVIVYR
ncbi:Universal stress protein UspA [Paraburkholderia tropica]|nr:Universal stress protein UspA [Paraburkholderia tropica]